MENMLRSCKIQFKVYPHEKYFIQQYSTLEGLRMGTLSKFVMMMVRRELCYTMEGYRPKPIDLEPTMPPIHMITHNDYPLDMSCKRKCGYIAFTLYPTERIFLSDLVGERGFASVSMFIHAVIRVRLGYTCIGGDFQILKHNILPCEINIDNIGEFNPYLDEVVK